MSQNFEINKLRVAKPCHMSWENMSGDERVRMCNACDMNIYNISEMTSAEINSLIETREGRLCGRIVRRNDGTVMTKDCPPGIRGYHKRISRFAGAAFATILALFSFGYGQKDSNEEKEKDIKITRTETQKEKIEFGGTITDKTGAPIPEAKITFIKQGTKDKKGKLKTKSMHRGLFEFKSVTKGVYYLKVKAEGFKEFEIEDFVINKNEDTIVHILLESKSKSVVVGIFLDPPLIDMTESGVTHTIDVEKRIIIKN